MNESLRQLIHEILLLDWDPIGIQDYRQAQDEYDDYIDGILRLLTCGASTDVIAEYLANVESNIMQVKGIDAAERRRVAEKLL